jgi:hypothetical protein
MAAGIPGARFVPLESQNHVILPSEPAFARFLEEVRSFLRSMSGTNLMRGAPGSVVVSDLIGRTDDVRN